MIQADSEGDVTDAWVEVTDPGNERGDVATALFEHSTCIADAPSNPDVDSVFAALPILSGLRVENIGIVIYPREWVLKVFGPEWVSKCEADQYEIVNA